MALDALWPREEQKLTQLLGLHTQPALWEGGGPFCLRGSRER